MSETYRIPKRPIPAEVILPGSSGMPMMLFLGERAETHSGDERPSDLLNGPDDFLPFFDPEGRVVFVHRDTLCAVSVAVEYEFGEGKLWPEDVTSEATNMRIVVSLEDGQDFRGRISYLMPEGNRRLQDVLNLEDRFLILREENQIYLINKRRISRVSPLDL